VTNIQKTGRTSQDGARISSGRISHPGSPSTRAARLLISEAAAPPGKIVYEYTTNSGIHMVLERSILDSER
jgi:hypothetical protein